jgi:hypothetical protein
VAFVAEVQVVFVRFWPEVQVVFVRFWPLAEIQIKENRLV